MSSPTITANNIHIGVGVRFGKNVTITGKFGKPAEEIWIGDHTYFGDNVTIAVPRAVIKDYVMVHQDTEISGYKECEIGYCSWIGRNCILNSHGGLYLKNGVGIGAYSQLWTHIRFGDTLQGCRWESTKPMILEDDVWMVGHCIVSPIHAQKKSMALVGSVITKDMKENHIYGGSPAKDLTDKVGGQYKEVDNHTKFVTLSGKLRQFYTDHPEFTHNILVRPNPEDFYNEKHEKEFTIFDVSDRTFNKRNTPEEIAFMMSLLVPIKFFPRKDDYVSWQ